MSNGADLQYTLGLDGKDFNSTARAAEKTGLSLGRVLAGLGVTAFAGGILKRGFEFNQTMRDSEAAVAKVIAQFQHLDEVAARDSAAAAMRQIVELEPKAAGSLADLTNGFLSTLAASQAAGLSVQQNIDLVGRFANAMANANIPTEQLGQEMRSIVTANIGADSSLAKVLTITNEMVKQATEAGNLYGFLADRIGNLGEAGDTAAVAFSSLQSAVDKAAGSLASGLFNAALDGSKGLTAQIDANRDTFENFGAAIGAVSKEVVKFAGFVNQAANSVGRLVAITALMFQDGATYAEAAAAVDAVAEARMRDAEAAKQEAAATQKNLEAVSQEANAKKRAADAAKEATQKAGLNVPKEKSTEETGSKARKEGKDQAAIFDEVLEKQGRLDELKKQSDLDALDAAGKAAAIQKDILAAEQEIAALKSDPFSQDQSKILDAETRKVELERQFRDLQKEAAADAARAAEKAADQAKAQKEKAAEMGQARNDLLGELALLEAQAKGHNRKADAIKRQLQIERDKLEIMRQTGASEEEALKLATRKADLEAKIAKGQGQGGRSHIGGVTKRRMMGGHLSDFEALQKGESDFERLQKGPFGKDNLAGRAARSTSGGVNGAAARAARLMGQTDSRALSERGAAITSPPQPKPATTPAKNPGSDPHLQKLDGILSELKRLQAA